MIRKITLVLLSCLLLTGCVLYRLEQKLPRDIADWFDLHYILMNTKAPKWLARNMTEKRIFLNLPTIRQRKYIKLFWKVRREGLAEEFYNRYHSANAFFTDEGVPGWRTDRGKALLLLGHPQMREYITTSDNINYDPMTTPYNIEGKIYEVWYYYYRSTLNTVVFKYTGLGWRRDFVSLTAMQYNLEHERAQQKLFSPTEDGWNLLYTEVLK